MKDAKSPATAPSEKSASPAPAALGKQTLVESSGEDPEVIETPTPLPAGLRARFEKSLGADLSNVRLYTGPAANWTANERHARAYTRGQSIFFAAGQYAPTTAAGQELIAHEIAHTVQQRADAGVRADEKASPGAPEAAADRAADAMVQGEHAPNVGRVADGTMQAKDADASAASAADTPTLSAEDKQFLTAFVSEFRPILGVFPVINSATEAKLDEEERAKREVAAVASLKSLFSVHQRTLLADFIKTRHVPDDLFIGIQRGSANVPQRTLIAAHILAKGVLAEEKPGDANTPTGKGKVRAENCGRWAEFVWIYAGVNSAKGDPSAYDGTKMGSTGPTGQTSFGGTAPNQVIGAHGSKNTNKEADESAEACTIPTGKLDALGAPDIAKMHEYLMKLEPGDWFWVDNGNIAGHSLIFVEWIAKPAPGTSSKGSARVFSQQSNGAKPEDRKGHIDGGGELHTITLGYPMVKGSVNTVTMITRPAKDAEPPTDAKSLLDFDRAKAAAENAKQIKKKAVSLTRYHRKMVTAASGKLGASDDYNAGTRSVCAQVMSEAAASATVENLSTLIALVQRMSSTDSKVTKKDWKVGRRITGIFDLDKPTDTGLIPGGVDALKDGASDDLPW